jgi:large subunit ribosomal protein L2
MVQLPSGVSLKLLRIGAAILGRNSNILRKYEIIGKAGINRKRGIRPTVRGVAMNPVDHPHGGRTKVSQPEVSP